jgi:uncharacterized membrane protein
VVFIQELVLRKKKKLKLSLKQKLSLHSLQRQLQLLKMEEYLMLVTFVIGGVLGRILLQGVPSVEPITFFALLAGALFGWRKGAVTGASTWFLSNFFMFGGQGPWSLVHVFAGAFAGFLGGFLQKRAGYVKTIGLMVVATLFFEVVMNVSSGIFFGFGIIVSFLSAVPFMLTHLGANIGLSLLIPKARKVILEKGKLNEKEICKEYIQKIKAGETNENKNIAD